jgi:hypothetical protein
MNLLLIGDLHHFSTYDVFSGYRDAFKKLGIPFDSADLTELIKYYSMEMSWGLVLAKMLNVESNFTHILFISGLITPDWILKSKYDKKIGIIGLDDPHASKITMNKFGYLDYYFTNEKKMENENKHIYYLPTATSSFLPTVSKDSIPENYKCDVSFIGTIYDDRIKPLEEVCEYCRDNNLTIKIIGPHLKTPKDSIIRKYAVDGILGNMETKLLYRGSKVVLNLDRNIKWNPIEDEGNSWLEDIGEAYSLNPRAYEIAGCRSTQLYVNPRQEAKDIFGDNMYYSNVENIKETLNNIFKTDVKELEEKINNSYSIIYADHTYLNRAQRILDIIEKQDKGEQNV